MWGLIPAAGLGSRIQPLGFSKELLPVGAREEASRRRPQAVSEYLVERMLVAGVNKICFVISPAKTDILRFYGGNIDGADVCYVIQPEPGGLCDALFRARPLVNPGEPWMVGLPDTIWFPKDALRHLPDAPLSFLLFPVEQPERFDAVVTGPDDRVERIQVKQPGGAGKWVWGAFRMRGETFLALHDLWLARARRDEYWGTLVNAHLERGGEALGIKAGESYTDVGTLWGFEEALRSLGQTSAAS